MPDLSIVAISDTHLNFPDLPSGRDLLIHPGDWSGHGTRKEVVEFNKWLGLVRVKFKYKPIVVYGNHELWSSHNMEESAEILSNATVLTDEGIEIGGKKIYGTPFMPLYGPWAFMKSEHALANLHYSKIPEGLDLLITHGPAKFMLDRNMKGDRCGSESLYHRFKEMKEPPKTHCFGHIHAFDALDARFGDRRPEEYRHLPFNKEPMEEDGVRFFNASVMSEYYSPEYTYTEFVI